MSEDRPQPQPPARPARAGWFEDPDDPEQLRYFDGILWTKNTTPRRTVWGPKSGAAAGVPGADTDPRAAGAPSHGSAQPAGPYGYPRHQGAAPEPSTTGGPPHPGSSPLRTGAPGAAADPAGRANGPTTDDGDTLASIPARFAAWMLDSLITWSFGLLIGMPLLWRGLGNYPEVVAEALRTGATDAAALAQRIQLDLPWIGAFAVVQMVVGVAYQTAFLSRRGATPGKEVVGISVRLRERRGILAPSDALRRSVLRPVLWMFTYTPVLSLFALPLSLFDAASALWDPQRQTLHDRIGRTVVVRGRQERSSAQTSTD